MNFIFLPPNSISAFPNWQFLILIILPTFILSCNKDGYLSYYGYERYKHNREEAWIVDEKQARCFTEEEIYAMGSFSRKVHLCNVKNRLVIEKIVKAGPFNCIGLYHFYMFQGLKESSYVGYYGLKFENRFVISTVSEVENRALLSAFFKEHSSLFNQSDSILIESRFLEAKTFTDNFMIRKAYH